MLNVQARDVLVDEIWVGALFAPAFMMYCAHRVCVLVQNNNFKF